MATTASSSPVAAPTSRARPVRARRSGPRPRMTASTFDSLETLVSILRTILLAFAAVAVLVGSFTIFNSLSITVAQRTKEFGLLRMVGATRRQVRGAVLLEALTIGLLASAAGIGVGVALAEGLNAPVQGGRRGAARRDVDDRSPPARSSSRSLVGTLATVLAAMIPARRATKIAPVAALRDSAPAAKPGLFARGVRGLAVARRPPVGRGRRRRRLARPPQRDAQPGPHRGHRARADDRRDARDRRHRRRHRPQERELAARSSGACRPPRS